MLPTFIQTYINIYTLPDHNRPATLPLALLSLSVGALVLCRPDELNALAAIISSRYHYIAGLCCVL